MQCLRVSCGGVGVELRAAAADVNEILQKALIQQFSLAQRHAEAVALSILFFTLFLVLAIVYYLLKFILCRYVHCPLLFAYLCVSRSTFIH